MKNTQYKTVPVKNFRRGDVGVAISSNTSDSSFVGSVFIVRSVCEPFVFVEDSYGNPRTLDERRYAFKRAHKNALTPLIRKTEI